VIKSRICILIFTSWKNTCRYKISPHNWFFMIEMAQHTTIDVVASHDLQQFLTICSAIGSCYMLQPLITSSNVYKKAILTSIRCARMCLQYHQYPWKPKKNRSYNLKAKTSRHCEWWTKHESKITLKWGIST
jgi:hypothetical protein